VTKNPIIHMFVISWNVAGWSTTRDLICSHYGSVDTYFEKHGSPDIVCLQETKIPKEQLSTEGSAMKAGALLQTYTSYWAPNRQKGSKSGFNGVATFVKNGLHVVGATQTPLQDEELDLEGRCLMVDFGSFVVFNAYVPYVGKADDRSKKQRFLEALQRAMDRCRSMNQNVILMGDLNVTYRYFDSKTVNRYLKLNPQGQVVDGPWEVKDPEFIGKPFVPIGHLVENRIASSSEFENKGEVHHFPFEPESVRWIRRLCPDDTLARDKQDTILPEDKKEEENKNNNEEARIKKEEEEKKSKKKEDDDWLGLLLAKNKEERIRSDENENENEKEKEANTKGEEITPIVKPAKKTETETREKSGMKEEEEGEKKDAIPGATEKECNTTNDVEVQRSASETPKARERYTYRDVFAALFPTARERFTCWNQTKNLRYKNIGSRIDYTIVDDELLECVDKHPLPLFHGPGVSGALAACTLNGQWKEAPSHGMLAGSGLSLQRDDMRLNNKQFIPPSTGMIYTPPSYSDHIPIMLKFARHPREIAKDVQRQPWPVKLSRACQPWTAYCSAASFFKLKEPKKKKVEESSAVS